MNHMSEVVLPAAPTAPRKGRDWLEGCCGAGLANERLSQAKLLVSELVSNAVRHGRGQVTVRAHLNAARLLVEVIDDGGGVEVDRRERDVGGWGLGIVDAVASRWGICEGFSEVWFELERPQRMH